MVGVNSPPGRLKSIGIRLNFLMCAARLTDFKFVASMHFYINFYISGFLQASSVVERFTPALSLKN